MNFNMTLKSISIAIFLIATYAAHTGAAAQSGEKIAVFTKNQTNPFFQVVRLGADSAAKQMGAVVTHYVPTKPDSIPEQLSQIDDVVIKKPNAIVFTPVDYKAMGAGVLKMNAAGIPVVNITDRSEAGKFVAFVGASDYELGLVTARYLIKTMGNKGNVIILDGVKADRWRILIGDDAHRIDERVRAAPEQAYDEAFFDSFAAEVGWKVGRQTLIASG